jgi:hypothetical protein
MGRVLSVWLVLNIAEDAIQYNTNVDACSIRASKQLEDIVTITTMTQDEKETKEDPVKEEDDRS